MGSSTEKADVEARRMQLPTLSAVPSTMQHLRRSSQGGGHAMSRTGSISIATGPQRVNPGPKIVGEFRTLRYDGIDYTDHHMLILR